MSRVDVDLPSHRVTIGFDGRRVSGEQLCRLLEQAGYPSSVVGA